MVHMGKRVLGSDHDTIECNAKFVFLYIQGKNF